MQATGALVGVVSADERRTWPGTLDMLFEGQVSYGGRLLSGEGDARLGRPGWQNKYAGCRNDEFHFTGSIGGTASSSRAPWWTNGRCAAAIHLSLSARIAFGEFLHRLGLQQL